MNFQSLVGNLRRKAFTHRATRVRPRKPNHRLRIEELEIRLVPATIPAPIVDQRSFRSIDNTAWAPSVAVNPTNPNLMFMAFQSPGGNGTRIAVRYSTDAGVTWADRLLFTDPILGG